MKRIIRYLSVATAAAAFLILIGLAVSQFYVFKRLQAVQTAAEEQPEIPDYGNPTTAAADAADEARQARAAAVNAEAAAYQARDAANEARDAARERPY